MTLSTMAEHCNAECHLCCLSLMLSVTYKLLMLSIFMLNVIMLSVVMLSVFMLNVVMLSVVATMTLSSLNQIMPKMLYKMHIKYYNKRRVSTTRSGF